MIYITEMKKYDLVGYCSVRKILDLAAFKISSLTLIWLRAGAGCFFIVAIFMRFGDGMVGCLK